MVAAQEQIGNSKEILRGRDPPSRDGSHVRWEQIGTAGASWALRLRLIPRQ